MTAVPCTLMRGGTSKGPFGADSLTSKVAVIGPSTRPDASAIFGRGGETSPATCGMILQGHCVGCPSIRVSGTVRP